MPQVTLSEPVLAEIWKRANPRPFENLTPEIGLRRVFNMPAVDAVNGDEQSLRTGFTVADPPQSSPRTNRQKAPKASLERLTAAGLVRKGETLYLVDYQRKRVPGVEATIQGALLSCAGQHGTMSYLAQKQLSKCGYESQSVRGPAHWINSKSQSIMQLWEEYLSHGGEH